MGLLNVVNIGVVFEPICFHKKENAMNFVGIDLHKQTISVCVVSQERKVSARRTFRCCQPDRIRVYFAELGEFQAVIEATASYEWLWVLLEPLADRIVLAHPGKMRIIAESTRKSDKLDAEVLAAFLALDMIPQAYRPSPRERAHRVLVRHRRYLSKRSTALRNKMRRILSDYNADREDLFTAAGTEYLKQVAVSDSHRFVLDELLRSWSAYQVQLEQTNRKLRAFARQAPVREREAREVLRTIPYVGPVTIDVVLSELGQIERFGSQKQVCAYAGLAPGQRESAGRVKQQGITKTGSSLLRWALIETAWRLVSKTRRWRALFEPLAKRRGRKKAIVAIARRLLCMMTAMLKNGQPYRYAVAS